MPRRLPLALPTFLALLPGCFAPAAPEFTFDEVRFENDYTNAENIALRAFRWSDLLCPDGEPAEFYAVYREDITEPAPLVLFFHAGAFDYVVQPDLADPLGGEHYAPQDRMNAVWASEKVFETFGLLPGGAIDAAEVNAGTLPAVLADKATVTLYPANCWGDLWHNETGYTINDANADAGVTRQGRFLAWAMTRLASKNEEERTFYQGLFGFDTLPVPIDTSGIYVVGLGEGGRALPELLRRAQSTGDANMPDVRGAILDSVMDNLYTLASNPQAFPAQREGLERVFYQHVDNDIGQFSLGRYYGERALTYPIDFRWSSEDPLVPDDTNGGFRSLQPNFPNLLRVTDAGTAKHVTLNNSVVDARSAADWMLGN